MTREKYLIQLLDDNSKEQDINLNKVDELGTRLDVLKAMHKSLLEELGEISYNRKEI